MYTKEERRSIDHIRIGEKKEVITSYGAMRHA